MKEKFHRDMGSETTKYVMKLSSYAKDGSPVYETTYVLNQNEDEWVVSNNAFNVGGYLYIDLIPAIVGGSH